MPGKNLAIASLVCGIASLVMIFFGYSTLLGIGLGIAAIVLSVNAKKQGYVGGMRTAGLVFGIIGLVLCGITFIACTVCVGAIGAVFGGLVG